MLSMSGLKAGLVSLFQLFGNRLVSMLGPREPVLGVWRTKVKIFHQSLLFELGPQTME